MRPVLRLLPYLLIAAFAAWCAVKLCSELTAASLRAMRAAWGLVLVAAALSLLNYLLRALRWRWYLARLGQLLPLGFCGLTYSAGFAFTLSPGKLGEVMRARYYTPLGIPLRAIGAAFLLERAQDVFAVLALAVCAISLLPIDAGVIRIWAAAAAGCAALLAVGPRLLQGTRRPPHVLTLWNAHAPQLPRWLSTALAAAKEVGQTARPLVQPAALLIGLFLGLCAWGLEALGLYVLGFMFPTAHLTLHAAIGIYAVAILAGAVIFLPGGLGGTEAVMTALLVSQGLAVPDAMLLTLVCRLVTLWFAVGIGWVAVISLRLRPPAVELLT